MQINSVNNSFYTMYGRDEKIRPLPANGHIIKNSLLDLPRNSISDLINDVKALKNGAKGVSGDYELGRVDNIGLKTGGLLMALYLMSKDVGFSNKIKPLIGIASFFASMAIWPKIAIQLPARIFHGFNIMQEYQDNYGRRKPFYQDTQFLPWDLYTDEQIEKFGDRLNVPKDIKNRREYVQEKMRKIALQCNTIWMLTAGFATPIMASLISHKLHPFVSNLNLAKLKKVILGANPQVLMDKNPQRISDFVNNYSVYQKNDILNIFNYTAEECSKSKDVFEKATEVFIEKLKNSNVEQKVMNKLDEIIKIEKVISEPVAKQVITDLKLDYLRLLHIVRNKNLDKDVLVELISTSGDLYKETFSDVKFKSMRRIFAPDLENNKIENEKICAEYEKYKADILRSIKEEDEIATPVQATDGLILEIVKERYNNQKWFKKVGFIGLGLYLTTVFSQLFFGKMEDKHS